MSAATPSADTSPRLPSSPFRGLAPFEASEMDAMLFFGREREREIVTANLLASRVTVLYGPSGVGKTSLLRAGVTYELRSLERENAAAGRGRELAVVVFSSWSGDVVAGIRTAVETELFGTTRPEHGSDVSLVDALEAWTDELEIDLYLILDQAEEYFVYHGTNGGERGLLAQLPQLLTRPGLRVNCLLSLREEALATLDVFKAKVPNLLSNRLRLEHLDHGAGRAAIVGPVEVYNRLVAPDRRMEVEPELVDAVLRQVERGSLDYGRAGRGRAREAAAARAIEAPYLQLVMQRLWEAEQTSGSTVVTLETLRRVGGAQQVVEDHLVRALGRLTPREQDAAAGMFRYLVTPSGTKIAHGISDLRKYAAVSEAELDNVLEQLSGERILRPLADNRNGGGGRYEIFHDVLAEAVLAWRAGHESQRELEATRREADRRHRRVLVVAVVAMVALALMAAITVFALTQRSHARLQARRAHARALVATAVSELLPDPQRSLRLAVEAAALEHSSAVVNALRQALLASRERLVLRTGGPVATASFDPPARTVLVGSRDGKARLYQARTGRLLHSLKAGGPVTAATFGAGGRLVATGAETGWVRLWEAPSGRRLWARRTGGEIGSVAFSADGKLLLAASLDRAVRVWRVGDGSLRQVLPQHQPVESASFSPDARGSRILTTTQSAAWIFETRSGKLLHRLWPGYKKDHVLSASFSPKGTTVVTTSAAKTALLWDAWTGRVSHELPGHLGQVTTASFSPDSRLVVTASADEAARVWEVSTGEPTAVLTGQTNQLTDASFSPDGKWVLTASLDRSARIFRASSGGLAAVLTGHRDSLVRASYASSGARVVTASTDGTARVWDPGTEDQLRLLGSHRGSAQSVEFSHDGRLAVSAGADGTARIWRVRDRRQLLEVVHLKGVTSASFAGDDTRVLTTSLDGTARLTQLGSKRAVVLRQGAPILNGSFSPDERQVVTGGADGTTRVWRTVDGKALRTFRERGPVQTAAFSPDGKLVLTASADGTARLWELDRGTLVHVLGHGGHGLGVASAAFSPSGRLVVTVNHGRTAALWDARTGKPVHVLSGHRRPITSASFSPDSRLVVTTSRDHDGRIWSAATGHSLHVLRGHITVVNQARFSPDGRWIVTAGPQTAGLWAVSTGRIVLYLHGHREPLTSASFSPDGHLVATSSEDGTVRLFRCEICAGLDRLVVLARQRLRMLAG